MSSTVDWILLISNGMNKPDRVRAPCHPGVLPARQPGRPSRGPPSTQRVAVQRVRDIRAPLLRIGRAGNRPPGLESRALRHFLLQGLISGLWRHSAWGHHLDPVRSSRAGWRGEHPGGPASRRAMESKGARGEVVVEESVGGAGGGGHRAGRLAGRRVRRETAVGRTPGSGSPSGQAPRPSILAKASLAAAIVASRVRPKGPTGAPGRKPAIRSRPGRARASRNSPSCQITSSSR